MSDFLFSIQEVDFDFDDRARLAGSESLLSADAVAAVRVRRSAQPSDDEDLTQADQGGVSGDGDIHPWPEEETGSGEVKYTTSRERPVFTTQSAAVEATGVIGTAGLSTFIGYIKLRKVYINVMSTRYCNYLPIICITYF